MKHIAVFLFLSCLAALSCKVEQVQSQETFDIDQYFANVAKVENCMGEDDSFISLSARLDKGMKAPLDTVNSAVILKNLYYEAHKRQAAAPPRSNPRCSDSNYIVKDRVLQRLAELKNEAAINVFIEIYKDESLPLQGNDAQGMVRSMTNCGKAILPKLEPVKNLRPQIGSKVILNLKK